MIYKQDYFEDADVAWDDAQIEAYHAKHLAISIKNFKQNFISIMKAVSDQIAEATQQKAEAVSGESSDAARAKLIQEAAKDIETVNQMIQAFLIQYFDFTTGQVTALFNEHYTAAQQAERAAMEDADAVDDTTADEGKEVEDDHDAEAGNHEDDVDSKLRCTRWLIDGDAARALCHTNHL